MNIPSSHRGRGAHIRGGMDRQHQDGEQHVDTTRAGLRGRRNGVLEEGGTLREERDGILENRAKLWGGEGKARFV